VGKSTLFKAITNKQVDVQNYPFTTIEPNVGVVEVPDTRVDQLAQLSGSKKKIYATIEFTDIAGLVAGAHKGEGLGNKFLANIRETDAIIEVVRAFDDGDIIHVNNQVNPSNDIGVINAELILADLDTVVTRLENTKKKGANDKEAKIQLPMLERFATELQKGTLISALELTDEERALARELNLLTAKPFLYVINVSDTQLAENWQPDEVLRSTLGSSPFVVMCNKLELELSELAPAERTQFLTELGLPESGLDQLVRMAYKTLGLLSFLTTGPEESRAWTAHVGDPIPRASRAIHTDFERLFIRAEAVPCDKLIAAGGYGPARAQGVVKTVGRDYIIQDGDVVDIKIGQ
jgi:GTP-binding protein YchF